MIDGLRLVDRGLAGLDLLVDAVDRRLLRGDLVFGRGDRELLVGIVEIDERIAGLHRPHCRRPATLVT